MVNEKQMRVRSELEHTKMLRGKASSGRKGANLLPERETTNQEKRRAVFWFLYIKLKLLNST